MIWEETGEPWGNWIWGGHTHKLYTDCNLSHGPVLLGNHPAPFCKLFPDEMDLKSMLKFLYVNMKLSVHCSVYICTCTSVSHWLFFFSQYMGSFFFFLLLWASWCKCVDILFECNPIFTVRLILWTSIDGMSQKETWCMICACVVGLFKN